MSTCGIAIDAWKLPIFKRVLTNAGYTFTKNPGLTADTLLLKVKTDNILALKTVIEKANKVCKS